MDYRTLLYGPVYTVIGVNARIITAADSDSDSETGPTYLRVCDLTKGVDNQGNVKGGHTRRNAGATVGEFKPGATVRASELSAKGLTEADLANAEIQFNGYAWEIINTYPMASPRGNNDGEILMILNQLHALESESEVPSELPSENASESESATGSESESEAFAAHDFTFPSPLLTWTINHNLGYNPSVYTYDLAGDEMEGAVSHPNLNQVVVTFTVATAGTARLI